MPKAVFLALFALSLAAAGQDADSVAISGRITDPQGSPVAGATVDATDPLGRLMERVMADSGGRYEIRLKPGLSYALVVRADAFEPVAAPIRSFDSSVDGMDLQFGKLQGVSAVVEVTEHIIEPSVERRDAEIFNKTLFSRDDQIFQTLGAGLNFGQHAGGGKSLEVRRFGFNLDHGGAGGGVRFMRDGVFINDIAGGHAHGYLGSLKGLTPELVEAVNLINGPFDAQYGDFSALGVVTIDTRRSLQDTFLGRIQFGQFNTRRFVGGYSPEWGGNSLTLAFENSYTDGPFKRPLEYNRNNATAVYSRALNATDRFTLRAWGGTSKSFAPGQLPLDAVEHGRLDRYGFIDPTEGNDEQSGTLAAYWERETSTGETWKANAVVNRALFDLYSNFTFFLDYPDLPQGDAIVQHSSRLQQQGNLLYQKPHVIGGGSVFGTFHAGANLVANQANLVLAGRNGRAPTDLRTAANIAVTNPGFYGQENLVFGRGRFRFDAGLRYDVYTMSISDRIVPGEGRSQAQGFWQPKFALAYTPKLDFPLTFHANYGRSNTSADARSLLALNLPKIGAITDFYQTGASYNQGRFSGAASLFLIDRSNEFVYVSDSGLTELGGPSRSTGFEVKSSFNLTSSISINGSISKVLNAYYRDTEPREYVIRAPHFTAYSALTVSNWHQWSGSLRFRTINHYTLNGDNSVSAPGHTVWDFSVSRPVNRWLDLNFSVDNLFDKSYYETLALYESRLPGEEPSERIHGTTGYPRTFIGGVTLHLFPRD